jgi:DNA-directed RNA polymerase subunit RPC12/RpoP
MATTDTTTTTSPTPTPETTLHPDDGSAPLSSLQFFCATCGEPMGPVTCLADLNLQRPQTRYTYSCPTCNSKLETGEIGFEIVVFHDSRQTQI